MEARNFTTEELGMIDRMAIAIVDGSQARGLLDALREAGFRVTVVDAVGGFFHDAMVTLPSGWRSSDWNLSCAWSKRTVRGGGATSR